MPDVVSVGRPAPFSGSPSARPVTRQPDVLESIVIAKVTRRLVPLLIVCFFAAFLDRVNVGFAALTMNKDIGLSMSAYAFGAGVFFLPYFVFEIPSNLLLEQIGARVWITRIMLTWGVVSAANAFVRGPVSFYVVRALLGAAEAGFFPGVIFFLTLWFPEVYCARVVSGFMMALPLSYVVGAPISGALLGLDGVGGLEGWRWLFIMEAVPSIVLAAAVFLFLTDRPQVATWLDEDERRWLVERLDEERRAREAREHFTVLQALVDPTILLFSAVYFGLTGANYGVTFFVPQIVESFGFTNLQTGFVSAVPYVVGAVAMAAWARRSDRANERRLHTVMPLAVTAIALAAAAVARTPILTIAALAVTTAGIYAAFPVFWALPTAVLSGSAAAGGIALINSIGNLSGFVGPYAMGWFKDLTGSYTIGLLVLAGLAAAAATTVVVAVSSDA